MNALKIGSFLNSWYRENKRPLPWRKTRDPYLILLSEVMLQQTTVGVVIPYFEKFKNAFPKVEDLAHASEEQVHSLWSGLGYYSRARNLHRAAQVIVQRGQFPKTYETLLELPGIGPYTAAAVASIAFDESVAAIDGNVARVVARLFDIPHSFQGKMGREEIQERAQALIKKQIPSEHNQAMMELGATLCTPHNPTCLLCPVSSYCLSFKAGTVLQRPVKIIRKKQEPWLWQMYIVTQGEKVGLVKSDNGTPWLRNTWVLPGRAIRLKEKEVPRSHFRHSITHHKIFVRVLEKNISSLEKKLIDKIKWCSVQDLDKVGTSSVVQKALKYVGSV